jgi:hypothetical protein
MNNEKIVYYCDAMKFFGDRMQSLWGYRKYNHLTDRYKPVFFEGLYFVEDYFELMLHCGEKKIFWNGTDIKIVSSMDILQRIIREIEAKHYCHSADRQKALGIVGIRADVHPLFFGDLSKYQVSYEQSYSPQVYMHCNAGREVEYKLPEALAIAKEADWVTFNIYGVSGENTSNVIYHGWVDESMMDEEIKKYHGFISFTPDKHASQTMVKSALMAQYPISVNPISGVWHGKNKEEMLNYLSIIGEQKAPNYELREKYLKMFERQEIFE